MKTRENSRKLMKTRENSEKLGKTRENSEKLGKTREKVMNNLVQLIFENVFVIRKRRKFAKSR